MSRRAARFTEADVARALKAACRVSPPATVEVLPDGTIRVVPSSPSDQPKRRTLAAPKEIVL